MDRRAYGADDETQNVKRKTLNVEQEKLKTFSVFRFPFYILRFTFP
jgi:hypothetical protein